MIDELRELRKEYRIQQGGGGTGKLLLDGQSSLGGESKANLFATTSDYP